MKKYLEKSLDELQKKLQLNSLEEFHKEFLKKSLEDFFSNPWRNLQRDSYCNSYRNWSFDTFRALPAHHTKKFGIFYSMFFFNLNVISIMRWIPWIICVFINTKPFSSPNWLKTAYQKKPNFILLNNINRKRFIRLNWCLRRCLMFERLLEKKKLN